MTLRYYNRTQEALSGTPGTSTTVTVAGAAIGHVSFASHGTLTTSDTFKYLIEDLTYAIWEIGLGTWQGSSVIERTTVLDNSSGTTARLSFGDNSRISMVWEAETLAELEAEATAAAGNIDSLETQATADAAVISTTKTTTDGLLASVQANASAANAALAGEFGALDDTLEGSGAVLGGIVIGPYSWADGVHEQRKIWGTSWQAEAASASRGNHDDFPEGYSPVTFKAGEVTMWDGGVPDSFPMWMVFEGTPSTNMVSSASGNIKASAFRDGVLYISHDTTGLFSIDLVFEKSTRRQSTALGYYKGSIANRNAAKSYGSFDFTQGITSNTVNAVTATILPGAEWDLDRPGYRCQTVLVGTAAGASWICPDGTYTKKSTVYDATGAIALIAVDLKDGFSILASTTKLYVYESVPTGDIALTSADYTFDTAVATGPAISGTIVSANLVESDGSGNAVILVVTTNGLFRIDYLSGGTLSMISRVASTFATGGMVGNTSLCLMADTSAGSVADTEILPNGDFSSSTGYAMDANWTIDTGAGKAISDGSTGHLWRSDALVSIGETVTVEVVVTDYVSGSLRISFATGGAAAVTPYITANGTYTFTSEVIGNDKIYLYSSSFDGAVTNLSFKAGIADRSGAGNHARLTGTLTKTAVATGAELVAYSGFSASNYLERAYDADFDFGTGDFCVIAWAAIGAATTERIVSRAYYNGSYSGPAYQLWFEGGEPRFSITDDAFSTQDTATAAVDAEDGIFRLITGVRRGGNIELYVDGVLKSTVAIGSALGSLDNVNATIRAGGTQSGGTSPNITIALLRISASAPTTDQIRTMYRIEKKLFEENASASLGASSAPTCIDYDWIQERYYIGFASDGVIEYDMNTLQRLRTFDSPTTTSMSSDVVVDVAVQDGHLAIVTDSESVFIADSYRFRETSLCPQ